MDYLFLLGRILFGGFFVMFGLNHFLKAKMLRGYASSKGMPAPGAAVFLSGLMLLAGGLSIILGAYVTVGVWLLVIFLLLAAFTFHGYWKEIDPQNRMNQMMFFMRNIALIGAALMTLAIPMPWVYSIL